MNDVEDDDRTSGHRRSRFGLLLGLSALMILSASILWLWLTRSSLPEGVSVESVEYHPSLSEGSIVIDPDAASNREEVGRIGLVVVSTVSSGAPWCSYSIVRTVEVSTEAISVFVSRPLAAIGLRCNDDARPRVHYISLPMADIPVGDFSLRLTQDGRLVASPSVCVTQCG